MSVVSAIDDTAQQVVNEWLSLSGTTATELLHVGAILAGGTLSWAQNPVAYTGSGKVMNGVRKALGSFGAFDIKVAEFMNDVYAVFQQPNIEGIPIFAEQERVERTADTSEDPLIIQADKAATQYVCDNVNPHPRKVTVSGYLMSSLAVDQYLIVKPSLWMQVAYLDKCMNSRRFVHYKTHDTRFFKCLITNFTWNYDPKYTNGIHVDIQLQEFIPLKVKTELIEIGSKQMISDAAVSAMMGA